MALSRQAGDRTLTSVWTEYVKDHTEAWRNAKHAGQWTATYRTYVEPLIGTTRIDAIATDDVLAVLRPIWTAKPETASRVRGRIETILDYAKVRGWRDGENPARWRGHLQMILPAKGKVRPVQHHAALPWRQVPEFMAALHQRDGIAARALEFTILTAARSGEVRGARWEEIAGDVWVVPGGRMKAKREHRVPLSEAAKTVLDAMPRISENSLMFPGQTIGKPLSDMTLAAVLKRMGLGECTVHGFRSAFSEWAAETGQPGGYP